MDRGQLQDIRVELESATGLDQLNVPVNQVAALASDGEPRALDILLATIDTHRLAKPAISRQLFDPQDQEDVEQDVLIAVSRSIESFRGDSSFLTWLHTIATNCSLGFVRRRRETSTLNETEPSLSARFTSVATDKAVVQEAISQLPELYMNAVVLRDLQGYTYAEIADQLKLNLNTVRARIARGRALVSDQIGHSVDELESN